MLYDMKKERKIKGHYTLVDTHNADEYYSREDYQEYRDINGIKEDFDDFEYFNWARDMMQEEVGFLMDNLKCDKKLKDAPVIVEGSLGLWWGRPDIEPRYFKNVLEALYACMDNAYDVVIKKVGHRLEVVNMHHDGSNYFTLTFLTPTGEDRYLDHGKVSTKNMENVLKLPEYLF